MEEMEKRKGTFTDPRIQTDPFGSYTGQPVDSKDTPVQDADDL